MKMKLLTCFLLIYVVTGMNPSLTDAQSTISASTVTMNWNRSSVPCTPSVCPNLADVDHNGVLYILGGTQLYVLQPDRTPASAFDLTEVLRAMAAPRFEEFVSFEDGTLAMLAYSPQGFAVFAVDPQNNEVSKLPLSGRAAFCAQDISNLTRSFYRIGNGKQVIACSIAENGIWYIDIVNAGSATLEHSFPVYHYDPEAPPQFQVQGGHDGKLYFWFASYKTFLTPFPSSPGSFVSIARYDPTDDTWTAIGVQPLDLNRIPDGVSIDRSVMVAIDEYGSIYTTIHWTAESHHIDFIKRDAQGQVLWHLTENELGGVNYYPAVISEDLFLTITDTGPAGIATTKVDGSRVILCNSDAASNLASPITQPNSAATPQTTCLIQNGK